MPPRASIYRKGAELFSQGHVELDAETDNSAYFFVTGEHQRYDVRLMRNDTFNCTCRLGSLKAGKGVLCSHVVAAILFMAHRQEAPSGDAKV